MVGIALSGLCLMQAHFDEPNWVRVLYDPARAHIIIITRLAFAFSVFTNSFDHKTMQAQC